MKLVTIMSPRGGVGKTFVSLNLAYQLASIGKQVSVVDMDLEGANAHHYFGSDLLPSKTVHNMLLDGDGWRDSRVDVSPLVNLPSERFYIVPASTDYKTLARYLQLRDNIHETGVQINSPSYEERFRRVLQILSTSHSCDYLLLDSHQGLSNNMLMETLNSDIILMVMRYNDIDNATLVLSLLNALWTNSDNFVRRIGIVINNVPEGINHRQLSHDIGEKLKQDVITIIPHAHEVMTIGYDGLFTQLHPTHPTTTAIREIVQWLQ